MAFPRRSPVPRPGSVRRRWLPTSGRRKFPRSTSRISVGQEFTIPRVAANVTTPNGDKYRWGPDEPNIENVIVTYSKSGEMPGGHKEATITLARDPQKPWPDLELFSDVSIYRDGGEEFFNGQISTTPRVSGDNESITVVITGYQTALEDDEAVKVGFIDGDLSRWGEPTTQRRVNLAAFDLSKMSFSVGGRVSGASLAAILIELTDSAPGVNERCEVWGDFGGIDIGAVRYNFIAPVPGGLGAAINSVVYVSTDDVATAITGGRNFNTTPSANESTVAPDEGYKFAFLFIENTNGAWVGPSNGDTWGFESIKTIGIHNLVEQGTWPDIGFTAKQMLMYAIPLFSILGVDTDFFDEDNFVIPQAWYSDGQTLGEIVRDILKYSLYDWFVFGRRLFQVKAPGSYGRFWRATMEEANFEAHGDDIERTWDRIVVEYNETDGSTRSVGPPGSVVFFEDDTLQITDPEHPAVKADRKRQDKLVMNGVSNPAAASLIGRRFLEEAALLDTSGQATFTDTIMDENGIPHPVEDMQPGDYVSFGDADDTSYRKIVNANLDGDQRQVRADLDAPPSGMDALLERLQVGLMSRGV